MMEPALGAFTVACRRRWSGERTHRRPAAAGVDPMQARLNYMLNCQGCHAVDGRGLNDIPTMADFVGKFLTVDGGRAYLVQVPGSANSPLSDQQLAEVLNGFTDNEPTAVASALEPYTAAEVNDYRSRL